MPVYFILFREQSTYSNLISLIFINRERESKVFSIRFIDLGKYLENYAEIFHFSLLFLFYKPRNREL